MPPANKVQKDKLEIKQIKNTTKQPGMMFWSSKISDENTILHQWKGVSSPQVSGSWGRIVESYCKIDESKKKENDVTTFSPFHIIKREK